MTGDRIGAQEIQQPETEFAAAKEVPLIEQTVPVKIVWMNVTYHVAIHVAAVFGLYLGVTGQAKWQTFAFVGFLYIVSNLGVTGGAHRLWSHKSFKATFPLRILLTGMQTLAVQNSVYTWARDHRVHHKYSETNADPHNARRGFFFAHVGWLLCRKHPAHIQKGKALDFSDLEADPVLMFQKKYYLQLVFLSCFVLPPTVCMYFWEEGFLSAFFFGSIFRFVINLHSIWLVNSVAHMWGLHPYDKNISPADTMGLSFLTLGEGMHNYHHTFPWDYKSDELGRYHNNLTTAFIDFMAWIGWAHDLQTVPKDIVMARVARTGDGTHESALHHTKGGPWGWGDSDIPTEDAQITQTLHKLSKKVN